MIDLDRLREETEDLPALILASDPIYGSLGAEEDLRATWEAARAVLDGPRVWWCAGHPEDMCESASPHDPPLPCGWVALVPITGEDR